MLRFVSTSCVALALAAGSPAMAADDFTPAMQAYLDANILNWAHDPIIVDAIRAANQMTSGYGSDRITELDQMWRAEVGSAATPTIDAVLSNPASAFLMDQVAASGGVISEVFVMDMVGLNVASSGVTSDMWQGDEAKHSETFGLGPDSVHFGDVELDESTQTYQGQISMTIVDPDTGKAIGAITVGVDATALL